MICPKCYSGIKDGSKFCTNCGEPLSEMQKDIESSCKKEIPFYSYLLGFLFTLFIVVMPITIYADNYQQVRNTYNTRSRLLQDKSQQKKVPHYARPRTRQNNTQRNTPYYARPRTRQNNTQRNTPYYARPRTNQGNIRQNSQYNVRSGAKQENDLQQTQSDTLYNDGQYRIHSQYASSESSTKNEIIKDDASSDLKTIRLVVSGEGTTKEEATKVALRNAIEQAFGTFVSSNTDVLNDDIVKDVIATVSSGNIQSYKELSSMDLGSTKVVNIEAIVSIGKLVSFAQSKGMRTELAGATFAMNMKMKELNKKNELIALDNLFKQLNMMADHSNLFNYTIETGEPHIWDNGQYGVNVKVNVIPNENALIFYNLYENTLKSLALSNIEIEEYENMRLGRYEYDLELPSGFARIYLRNDLYESRYSGVHDVENVFSNWIKYPLMKALSQFVIEDNLNNQICLVFIPWEKHFYPEKRMKVISEYDNRFLDKEKKNYAIICTPIKEGIDCEQVRGIANHNPSYPAISKKDLGVPYKPFELVIKLLYSPDVFSKLSSIQIFPIEETLFSE